MERLKIVNEQNLNYIKIYSCDIEQVEKGRVYGPTIRNHHLIHYVISGKGRVNVYGNLCECSSGTLIWIPPYTPFTYIADENEPWYYAWIGIAGGECNLLHKELDFIITNPTKQFAPGLLDSYFKDMAKHFVLDDATSRVKTLSTFYKMLSALPRENIKEYSREHARDIEVLMDALAIIGNDYWTTLGVDSIAYRLGVSRSYLYKIFKRNLNVSPKEYLMSYRLSVGFGLLRPGKVSVKQVADAVGFSSAEAFSKSFKKKYGIPPTENMKIYMKNQKSKRIGNEYE